MFILSISESILIFICGIGLLQGILLSILIYFHPKSDRTVNKFLAFYIACLSVIMSGPLILQVLSWKDGFFVGPFPVLAGPLLYFYIRAFREPITWQKALPHLALFFVYILFSYFFVQHLADQYPAAKDFPEEGFNSPVAIVFFAIRYIQLIVYYFLSRHELRSYQEAIRHLFSETSKIDLSWIKWLTNGYMLIIFSSIIIYFFMAKYPLSFYQLYLLNIAIATPYIYMATYKGITQPTIWQKTSDAGQKLPERQVQVSDEKNETIKEKPQSQRPGWNDNRLEEIIAKVTAAMDQDKIYQDPELSLQDLSERLKFPAHRVSAAINEGMRKSFYDLVNGYRVEEAKRLLLNPKNKDYTILSVGFEAGFNSKTTFNTVFKKFTGQTPTSFRDNQMAAVMEA